MTALLLRVATTVAALCTFVLAVLSFFFDWDTTWMLISMTLMVGLLTLHKQQQRRRGELESDKRTDDGDVTFD